MTASSSSDARCTPYSDLPTPFLAVKKSELESNIARIHREVDALDFEFRPQLETLRSVQLMRLLLADGKHRSVVCSTVAEIEGVLPLVAEGVLDEIIWGLPVAPSKLPVLSKFRSVCPIVLKIDSDEHVDTLEQFQGRGTPATPWPVFINVDIGIRHASVPIFSERLESVVSRATKSNAVQFLGFYADGRFSHDEISNLSAQDTLPDNIEGLFHAAGRLKSDDKVTIAIETGPSALCLALRKHAPDHVDVRLYAGNYSYACRPNVSIGLIDPLYGALHYGVEVCSISTEDNVALSDGGKIAYTKRNLIPAWSLTTLSQEPGLLGYMDPIGERAWDSMGDVEAVFNVGQKVLFEASNSAISTLGQCMCYVLTDDLVVTDVWHLW